MKIAVWDISTRVFHWALVAACVTAYLTSRTERYIELHAVSGYALFCFVLFRLVWGFVGNRYARFSNFIRGWKKTRDCLADLLSFKPHRNIGHNPAVGWVVLIMLAVLLVVSITGVVTYSGEENKGFLAGAFSFSTAQYAHLIHSYIAYAFVLVIVLHVSAALVHDFIFRENIIVAMITGHKEDAEGFAARSETEAPQRAGRSARLAAFLLLSVLGGWVLVSFNLTSVLHTEYVPHAEPPVLVRDATGTPVPFVENELWFGECGESCHGVFHPTLLPEKSWVLVMAGLDEHFGDDASLEPDEVEEILKFLVANSAERSTTEASQKILWTMEESSPLLRITRMPYWLKKHSKIKDEVYGRSSVTSPSNCAACHRDAAVGRFDDTQIVVPD
ncbi:MAG: cytochrome b/b6 domain-containing protein [Proteobacteria bacterium]|nr:cytochrome b/b6 domain-containing protein [Pseudomonadota bacterium]